MLLLLAGDQQREREKVRGVHLAIGVASLMKRHRIHFRLHISVARDSGDPSSYIVYLGLYTVNGFCMKRQNSEHIGKVKMGLT